MGTVALFGSDLPDFLQNAGVSELTKKLAGKTGIARIVPKNGIFRKVVGGEEMGKVKGSIKTVIVNASPDVGRIYYAKQWTPDAEPTAPDCFSNDGRTPDEKAANKQADRCDSCRQNIKGSGQGNSKACRYSRRLALLLEEDFGTALEGRVYQMNLSSKSLFGDSLSNGTHPFENYSKYLANNGESLDFVVTEISFNEDNDNQSVLFAPVRRIVKQEYEVSSKATTSPEVSRMVIMTPYQADMTGRTKQIAAPNNDDAEDANVVGEPTVRQKKAEPVVKQKADLNSVLKAWTDEE